MPFRFFLRRSKLQISVFLFACLLLESCTRQKLSVHTEYLTVERLASYFVETPDPRQYCPQVGQRLVIHWSFPEPCLKLGDVHLLLRLRLRNGKQEEVSVPISHCCGDYMYYLLNDDYFSSGGILTYKVDLIAGGEILEEWRHQIWSEYISFQTAEKTQSNH